MKRRNKILNCRTKNYEYYLKEHLNNIHNTNLFVVNKKIIKIITYKNDYNFYITIYNSETKIDSIFRFNTDYIHIFISYNNYLVLETGDYYRKNISKIKIN